MNVIQTADGSPTLFSERYNESFHSTFGAATESRYVFLESSGVTERFRLGLPTRILEIGFGLGLNALLSCDAAIASNTPLSYHAFEHDFGICELSQGVDFSQLLDREELADLLQAHLGEVVRLSELLDSDVPFSLGANPGKTNVTNPETPKISLISSNDGSSTRSTVVEFAPDATLNIHWGDATTCKQSPGKFDAIYLDAFSPDNNPECWTQAFFEHLSTLMAPPAKLSTYCAKGSVRRALMAAGFVVKKLPGPPGKREIMVASLISGE